jgi:hypothetical protein
MRAMQRPDLNVSNLLPARKSLKPEARKGLMSTRKKERNVYLQETMPYRPPARKEQNLTVCLSQKEKREEFSSLVTHSPPGILN